MKTEKHHLGISVLDAARQRISWAFDRFDKICISFSGGKDSTVMFHLIAEEARRRNRKFGVMFIDWEAQYKHTIDHVGDMLEMYKDCTVPYWICLPLKTVNATSQIEPEWICWEPGKETIWVRPPPKNAIKDQKYFPFYNYAMAFEEFVPAFEEWYSGGKPLASFVGVRTMESLNRWRSICVSDKGMTDGKRYTTIRSNTVCEVYPIYDWTTEDIWTYHGKNPEKPYNKLYDLMHMAGLPLSKMRICEPYGNEQKQGLWLFHMIEPETWSRVVARVAGANTGALYANEKGNVSGRGVPVLPEGYTWKSYALFLLTSMPAPTSEHYKNKIAKYLKYYKDREYLDGIPDWQENDCRSADEYPSWRRICKVLLMNDHWCIRLSFSPTKTSHYKKYLAMMKKRREQWQII